MRGFATLWKLDRILLAIYLAALIGLMLYPVGGPERGYLGIGIDKWMHFLLFGGLAVFVRWNLAAYRFVVIYTIGASLAVAVLTEIGQGLVSYRSAELLDIWAGFLGALLGAVIMHRIVSSPVPEKPVGIIVGSLGLMVGLLFALADLIGLGTSEYFGRVQMIGTVSGALILLGGIGVYRKGLRSTANV